MVVFTFEFLTFINLIMYSLIILTLRASKIEKLQ